MGNFQIVPIGNFFQIYTMTTQELMRNMWPMKQMDKCDINEIRKLGIKDNLTTKLGK